MEIARSDRLILRPLEPSDRVEVVAMHEAGASVPLWSPPLEPGVTFDQMFDRWLAANPAQHVRFVAEQIEPAMTPRIANIISLSEIVRGIFQNAFIGWKTHPAILNQGYCTEALRLALSHAFSNEGLKLHRIQANIATDNPASLRVAGKCRFRLEGVAQKYLYVRGRWRDHLMHAITAEEHIP